VSRRVVDAIDSLLGSTSPRGDLVRVAGAGAYTNRDDLDLPESFDDVDPCSPHRHGKLKGRARCFGCGRTKNEIELEEA
jgi:hypothetical protein